MVGTEIAVTKQLLGFFQYGRVWMGNRKSSEIVGDSPSVLCGVVDGNGVVVLGTYLTTLFALCTSLCEPVLDEAQATQNRCILLGSSLATLPQFDQNVLRLDALAAYPVRVPVAHGLSDVGRV